MQDLLKEMFTSECIAWKTICPMNIGSISCGRIGFASIPCVIVKAYFRPRDVHAVLPVVKQAVFRHLHSQGVLINGIDTCATVQEHRKRKVIDCNPESESCGENKMLTEHRIRFEIVGSESIESVRQNVPYHYEGSRL